MNTIPNLPEEILDHIFRLLLSSELCRVLQASRRFHAIGAPILYREIFVCTPRQIAPLLQSLCQNELYCSLIRKFTANFINGYLPIGTILFNQLHRVLKRLTALVRLSITFSLESNRRSLAWIFEGCTFDLKSFETSIRCDEAMARFLDTQPRITSLCLGGFVAESPFALQRSSLPNLCHVRVAPAGPSILAEIIRDRPVEGVSITLSSENASLALDSLQLSSRAISRLSIAFFDDNVVPSLLFPEISRRFSELTELHFFSTTKLALDLIENASTLLGAFRSLKYLSFLSPDGTPPRLVRDLAKSWYESCPTLRTIILPDGTVWFRKHYS